MSEELTNKNLRRAGEYFVYSLWIQSQMADLIILKKHPQIIEEFVSHPTIVPSRLVDERSTYWQKNFSSVKTEFKEVFSDQLADGARHDLSIVNHLRNAIAHSYVSLGREYLMYRPTGGNERERKLIEELGILPRGGAADPVIFKLDFTNDERYHRNFESLTRLDGVCFKAIAESEGLPENRSTEDVKSDILDRRTGAPHDLELSQFGWYRPGGQVRSKLFCSASHQSSYSKYGPKMR